MDLTLIRHGEAARVAPGSSADPPLSERGLRQAASLAERAARWKKPTAVYVSPAARARQTAEPLCAALGVTAVDAPWLAEVEAPGGANVDVAKAMERIEAQAMTRLRARLFGGLGAALAEAGVVPSTEGPAESPPRRWQLARDDARLVLVGHGMAHAVALEYLLGIEGVPWAGFRFQFAHAAFAGVRAFPLRHEWVFGLVRYNDTAHLPRGVEGHG